MEGSSPSDSSPKTDLTWLRSRYTTAQLMQLTGMTRYHCNRMLSGASPVMHTVAILISIDTGKPIRDFTALTELQLTSYDADKLHALMDKATSTQTTRKFARAAGITFTQYNNARHTPGAITLLTALKLARHFGVPVESLVTLESRQWES